MRIQEIVPILSFFFMMACGGGEQAEKDEKENKGGTEEESAQYQPSKEELSSYIKAEESIEGIRSRARQDVVDMVMEREMDMQRFRKLDEAEDPSELEDPIKEEEKKALQEIRRKRKEIWSERRTPMEKRAEAEGLTWELYQRVRDAVRKEGPAQERFKEMSDSMDAELPLPPKEKPDHMP